MQKISMSLIPIHPIQRVGNVRKAVDELQVQDLLFYPYLNYKGNISYIRGQNYGQPDGQTDNICPCRDNSGT